MTASKRDVLLRMRYAGEVRAVRNMRYPRIDVRILERRMQLFQILQRICDIRAAMDKEDGAFYFHQVFAAVGLALGEEADKDVVCLVEVVASPVASRLRNGRRDQAVGHRTLRS